MLDLGERVLFEDGTSLVSDTYACRHILKNGTADGLRVLRSEDAEKYELYYATKICCDGETAEKSFKPNGHIAQDSDLSIITEKLATPRDDTPIDQHRERVEAELEFFERVGKVRFLVALNALIERFIEDGVVWGGRGSSCASYVLYLLGVHDTNPIRFRIPFSEFSKETERGGRAWSNYNNR